MAAVDAAPCGAVVARGDYVDRAPSVCRQPLDEQLWMRDRQVVRFRGDLFRAGGAAVTADRAVVHGRLPAVLAYWTAPPSSTVTAGENVARRHVVALGIPLGGDA